MARTGLTRERIIAAGVAIADEHGLGALSMRRLAADVGVEAMSLYNRVANKRDVLEGMVDHVWELVDLARDEPDWRAALHRLAGSAHREMIAHPWFLSLPVIYGREARLRVIDATLAHMRGGGVGADAAFHAQHVFDGYVFGYSWQTVGYIDMQATQGRAEDMLATVDTSAMPHLMEHVHQHIEDTPQGDGFEFGLDLLLDGLEHLRAS